MYKLVIGTIKIAVHDDEISKSDAIEAANRQIIQCKKDGKYISQIDITKGPDGIRMSFEECEPQIVQPKTLRQSLLDHIIPTMRDKFSNPSAFAPKDSWRDNDTGQEWRGSEVVTAYEEVLQSLEEWIQSVYSSKHV